MSSPTLNVFIVYSRNDIEYLKKLQTHLTQCCRVNNLKIQSDGEISPGQPWRKEISKFLESAKIIVLLISSDFLNSDYIINDELPEVLSREKRGECVVIPVIVRPCIGWDALIQNQALPKDAKPISTWDNPDSAYVDITKGIERAAQKIRDLDKVDLLDESQISDESLFYKAFYYTYRKHETREIDFSIKVSKGVVSATVKGLHFDEKTEEETGEEYFGLAERAGNRLFFNLNIMYPENYLGSKESKKLQVILQFGNKNLSSHTMIVGAAQWISSYGYPVSAEILLFKLKTQNGFVEETDLTKIRRYMMFKRSMRRIPDRIVDITDDLKIKSNRLDQLSDILGEYRVWTYYKEGIVQSRLSITPDFNATFETRTYGRESGNIQVCLFNISTIQGRQRICMSHHPRIGTEILAYSIIDIPLEDQLLIKGVFCSMGRQGADYQHCGWMALRREQKDTYFDVEIYTPEKLQILIQAQPDLKDMFKFFNHYSDVKLKTRGRR
jgi:TIR domain